MLHLSHIPAQVAGIIVVTCCEVVWQHCLETVLLEEKVTVPLSAQEHERQKCRLDKAVHPLPPDRVLSGCLQVDIQLLICLGAIRIEIMQQHGNDETVCP